MSVDQGLPPRLGASQYSEEPLAQEAVGRQLRVVALVGWVEARRLCRNPLILAGLAFAATTMWWNSRRTVPQWWMWDVQIGSRLLAVSVATLLGAHLLAGRVRRDRAATLYDSFPTATSNRAAGYLLALLGPVALAAVLAVVAVVWIDLLDPVGTPRLDVIAQGLLLVALGGAIGVATGTWMPHPMVAVLTAVVFIAIEIPLVTPNNVVHLPGGVTWLLPWTQPEVLPSLPGPISVPPPYHLIWLAALTALAILAAFWFRPRRHSVAAIAIITAACLAVAWLSGLGQLRPNLTAQDQLVAKAVGPAQAEQCVTVRAVRYCAYPGFDNDVDRWASVVDGVLGRLPTRSTTTLTVRQVVDANFEQAPGIGYRPRGNSEQRHLLDLEATLTQFIHALPTDARLVPGASGPPVYVDLSWGIGREAGNYQLGLSLQTAWWAVGLPTTSQRIKPDPCGGSCYPPPLQPSCVPLGQARESIALWLAASATPQTMSAFATATSGTSGYDEIVSVDGRWFDVLQPVVAGYQPSLWFTAQGAALAKQMVRLPHQKVESVLAAHWNGWLQPQATDQQLADALGIAPPAAETVSPPAGDFLHGNDSRCQ